MRRKRPTTISDLPNCFIVEIIAGLPLDTVMTCKCVCKNWYDLLSDPIFGKLHLDRSPRTTVLTFVNARIPGGDKKAHLFDLARHRPERSFRQTSFSDLEFAGSVIFGSCNGLVLFGLRSRHELYVYNPIVKNKIKLPATNYGTDYGLICGFYGIGYSRVSRKYIVIKVTYCRSQDREVAELCEMGEMMSWRTIEVVPQLGTWWNRGGVFINGALYWFVTARSNNLSRVGSICCFDVGTEQFHLLLPPPPLQQLNPPLLLWKIAMGKWFLHCSYVRFLELGGCLSVCYFDENSLNLWVMTEHGVQESWTKVLVIDSSSEIFPLGMLPDGDIFTIMISRGELATYNLITQHLVIEERTREDCFVELVCRPSFISPGDL